MHIPGQCDLGNETSSLRVFRESHRIAWNEDREVVWQSQFTEGWPSHSISTSVSGLICKVDIATRVKTDLVEVEPRRRERREVEMKAPIFPI